MWSNNGQHDKDNLQMWRFYVPGGCVLYATGEEVTERGVANMLFVIGLLYIAYKFVTEESGMGDYYRDTARTLYKDNPTLRKAYEKKASSSDGAVAFGWMVFIFFGIVVLMALFQ